MDINEFVRGVNDPRLKEAVKRLGNTPEGKKILQNITPQDKQRLLNQLGSLSSSGITTEILLRQLNNNPDILSQISKILNSKR